MQENQSLEVDDIVASEMFLKKMEHYVATLSTIGSSEALQQYIKEDFLQLSSDYLAIGNQEFDRINASHDVPTNEVYLLHYAFSKIYKDVFLLHRDVMLQLEIAELKELEGGIDNVSVNNHVVASVQIITEATQYAIQHLKEERAAIYDSQKTNEKLRDNIRHQKNAWPVYSEQFIKTTQQIKEIIQSHGPMTRTITSFKKIGQYTIDTALYTSDTSKKVIKLLGETIGSINDMTTTSDIPKRITWITHAIIENPKDLVQTEYTKNLEEKVKVLTTITLPVATENGLLLTRHIDFNKAVKKWFDFEIIPLFMDLWEQKNTMETLFNHSLLNLKSSLLVEKGHDTLGAMPSQLQALKNVHQTLNIQDEELHKTIEEITGKIEEQFQATLIYSDEDFLDVSIQSSLSQFASSQGSIFTAVKNSITKRINALNSKYESGTLFSNQSLIDQSISCVSYRMFKEANAHYDTLFLNKNFIGDQFIVSRESQESAFAKAKTDWDNGFNKAVLLEGSPLSGKSTFLENISQKHFKRHTIFLKVDSSIPFEGRKIQTTKNIREALRNIKKNLSGIRPLLVIDDLEFWQDDTHSLLENMRALLRFVESESDRVLIIVSISRQMRKLLDQRLSFTDSFSTHITLEKASFEEIHKAFLIRHGASHKVLVSEKKEILSKKQIESQVLKLARDCHYNIGEVLQSWTYGTTLIEDNQVIYNPKGYSFYDFFTLEEVIVLKFVFLHKEMHELRLKTYVETHFESNYKSSLKRLTNLKVLLRNQRSQLYINPVIINDVKDILIYRGTLN